jgi:hypothetical protein
MRYAHALAGYIGRDEPQACWEVVAQLPLEKAGLLVVDIQAGSPLFRCCQFEGGSPPPAAPKVALRNRRRLRFGHDSSERR